MSTLGTYPLRPDPTTPGQVKVGPLEPAIAAALREAANTLDPQDPG